MSESSTTVLTLEDLAAMGDGESVPLFQRKDGDSKSPFTAGLAFPVEIVGAEPTTSKNGYSQVALSLEIVKSDGTTQKAGKKWESLPIDMPDTIDEEKAANLKSLFGRNLHNLLRAVDPVMFSIYAKKEGTANSPIYLDSDGNRLTLEDRKARTKAVESAVIGAAKAIRDGLLTLVGKRVFLVEVHHANGKIYTNWFAEPPAKFELADI